MTQFDNFLPWKKSPEKDEDASGDSFNDFLQDDYLGWSNHLCLRPFLYHVLITHSKETPTEFLLCVLQQFFRKSLAESEEMVKHIRRSGKGICATYTREIAEMKIEEVNHFAKENQYILHCMMEKGNEHAL